MQTQRHPSKHPLKALPLGIVTALLLVGCSAASTDDTNTSLEPTRTPAPAAIATSKSASVGPTAAPSTPAPRIANTKPAAPACTDVKPDLAQLTPKPTQAQGNIVYITSDGNIALTDATGRKKIDVTTDAFIDREKQELRVYQFPTFSNDGKSLAFVSVSTSATQRSVTQTLHVAAAAQNPKLTDLYTTAEDNIPYLDWSPDNKTVAFLTIGNGAGEIRTVSKTGGPVSVLDSGTSVYWHWRNDSSAIVAHLGGDAHISLISMIGGIANNSEQNTLTRIERIESPPGRFQSPQYSPDGKFMVFVLSVDREVNDLMLADAAGQLVCTITRIEAGAFFAWSPNGTQIAYLDTVSPMQQPGPLTILNLKTGQRTDVKRNAMLFFWSPDGTKLALYSLTSEGQPSQIGNATQKLAAPLQQNSTTALRIEVIDAATGAATPVADTLPTRDFMQFFPFFDQYSRAVTPWSPDSNNLVFVTVNTDTEKVDIGVATFNKTKKSFALSRIAAGSLAFWSPQ